MARRSRQPIDDDQLLGRVTALLEDPKHTDNALRAPLAELHQVYQRQRQQLERLIRISDGFQAKALQERESFAEACDRHLRRLEKLTRISDRYQESLRELKAALEDAALRDPLTALGNRRYLADRMVEEVERANRKGDLLNIALLDIDHFKAVNDIYGHDVGDRLLERIANTVRESLREYDICGRWGGEEFLLVFPHTPHELAIGVCERVRANIELMEPVESMEESYRITVTIGATALRPGETYSDAINRADDLLLKAKRTGRNRLLIADAEPSESSSRQ